MDKAIDLINRQQAEIERLKIVNRVYEDIGKTYSEIKKDAIIEFAERLKKIYKNHLVCDFAVLNSEIDNLVNEMVGDKNETM